MAYPPGSPPPDDPRPTRALALESAFWAALGSMARYLLAGATVLALTRLLRPADFGLIALTYAAQELIAHVATVGFHDALVQRPRLESTDLDSAFWSILALSGGFTLIALALAPFAARWFDQPALAALWIAVTLAAWVRAISTVPRALLARRMDFRTPALVRAGSMVIGGACAILVAALGGGAWSFVIQIVLINLIGTIVIWRVVRWRPGWRVSRPALSALWRFAPAVSIFTVLAYIISNADDQLVGYHLGADALGFYALAYSVMAWPVRDVIGGVAVVIYPIFARFQEDRARLQAVTLEALQLTTVFTFPTLALIAITAPVLIPLLFGARWMPIVLTTQILALSGLRESTTMLNGALYRAVGRPGMHTWLAFISATCYLTAFVIGLDFGIEGVAFFYALTGVLLQPVSWWLLFRVSGLTLGRWLRALVPTATAAALMSLAAVWVLHHSRHSWGMGDFPALALTGVASAGVYALSLWIFTPLALKSTLPAAWRVARDALANLASR